MLAMGWRWAGANGAEVLHFTDCRTSSLRIEVRIGDAQVPKGGLAHPINALHDGI
jgi:hypothetical protein